MKHARGSHGWRSWQRSGPAARDRYCAVIGCHCGDDCCWETDVAGRWSGNKWRKPKMSKLKVKRQVYRVQYKNKRKVWLVTDGSTTFFYMTSEKAIAAGRSWARDTWQREEILSQLVVHGMNGKIRFENTYGRDPARSKG